MENFKLSKTKINLIIPCIIFIIIVILSFFKNGQTSYNWNSNLRLSKQRLNLYIPSRAKLIEIIGDPSDSDSCNVVWYYFELDGQKFLCAKKGDNFSFSQITYL